MAFIKEVDEANNKVAEIQMTTLKSFQKLQRFSYYQLPSPQDLFQSCFLEESKASP